MPIEDVASRDAGGVVLVHIRHESEQQSAPPDEFMPQGRDCEFEIEEVVLGV